MTTMSRAMKRAGAALPLNNRVWTWLKDHPGKTSKDIAKALNVAQNSVSAVLTDMVARKMIEVKKEPGISGVPTGRYTTAARLKAFALLPKPKKAKKPAAPDNQAAPVQPAAVPSIESLSVKQAYELYKQLHAMFGGKGGQ